MKREDFGKDFSWGVTLSAFQNEGFANAEGKGPSIWDAFTANPQGKIANNDVVGNAAEFYLRYKDDIRLAASLGFNSFRFSLAWTRIQPNGYGIVNSKGVDFYSKVIDECLKNGLEPWITIYHWDLPLALEAEGGWCNRDIVGRFADFTDISTRAFGDRAKRWIVMNEPMSFLGLGYFMGYHAPERTGIGSFLQASHHAVLSMAESGRVVKRNIPDSEVGPALSCSYVAPSSPWILNIRAAKRVEAVLNRMYIEPLLGLGYPTGRVPALMLINKYIKEGDEQRMAFDFDFIGLQYYFRVVAKFSMFNPGVFAKEVSPTARGAKLNAMNLEVYPRGMRKVLELYSSYPQIKKLIVTESGVCYSDKQEEGRVKDKKRVKYHQKMLRNVKKAIKKGINVKGYFVWTLVDNFEWREGYAPRFGLIYNDFKTQQRIVKQSGYWFKSFLKNQKRMSKK